ncbi:hypothetical protein BBK82_15385 [Lentzea guizhouensis]|uniref:SD-repeat containing protein B domain-containing protein n=1 Tax=Lentzea guizhouensis TaxID=1586287 RepID=A0A1B2HHP0_9PSEU|nr:hypothetical protein BBK82_15385 [Lentzea guizhouensis]
MAVAVALPLMFTTGTALAQAGGTVGGVVFKDLNGDGVQQDAEPGIGGVHVVVRTADGTPSAHPTDAAGKWSARLPLGTYAAGYVDPKLGNTTHSNVEFTLGDTAKVDFGLRGGQICGLAWHDRDEDGRNNGEAGLAGRIIALNGTPEHAVTGADGGYCLEDLPAGVHQLKFSRKSDDPFVPTKPGGDSKFHWLTSATGAIHLAKGQVVKNVDLGLMAQRTDLRATGLTFDRDPANAWRVGDTLTVYGGVMAGGNAPQTLGGTLTLPEGLRITGTAGGLGDVALVQGQQVVVPFGPLREPGVNEALGVRVVVEKPFTAAEVRWEAGSSTRDTDLTDNVLTQAVSATSAELIVSAFE